MIDEKEIMQLGRIDLINFSILTNPNYVPNWHHLLIADYLEKAERGEIKRLIIQMPPRSGKQISNDTPVLTVNGWKNHGDLQKGDIVFGRNGEKVSVLNTSEETLSEYVVKFIDGSEIYTHGNHEWLVFDRKNRKERIIETKELFNENLTFSGEKGKRGHLYRYSVDYNVPVNKVKKLEKLGYKASSRWIHNITGVEYYHYIGKRAIVSVEKAKEVKYGKCIEVEGGIYLVGKNLIPTHNSQLASINFPAWYLGRNPNKEIITSSYSGDLAIDFGQKTRDLVRDEAYKAIFPELELREDSQAKNKWLTKQGGSYISAGVGSAITGRGANLFLIDDPIKNREEANSETMRKKTWEWFTSTAFTRLSPDGVVIIIQTRWHQDDLSGRIQEMDDDNQWTVLSLPAIAEKDERYIIKGKEYKRKEGEALWPDRYSLEETLKIKKQIGVYDFSCLYQQNAINEENQLFKKEWFTYYEEADIINKDLEVYVAVDLAGWEESVSDDNTSIQVVGKESGSNIIYKLEDFTGRFNPTEVIDNLFYLKDKYKLRLVAVGIETTGYQKALEFFLKQEMDKRGKRFNVIPLVGKTKKELRIKGLIPFYESRLIKHRSNGMDNALEDELLVFPFGKHDDRIDALAYMLQVMEHTKNPEKKRSFIPDYNKLY